MTALRLLTRFNDWCDRNSTSLCMAAAMAGTLSGIADARADDPPRPAPVVPVASITIPSTPPLILFGDGAVSKQGLSWIVSSPKGTPFKVYGSVLIIPDPKPGTTYKVPQVATGDVPPFAFDFADVVAPGAAPAPPAVVPPAPGPAVVDQLGMVAATRAILAAHAWTAEQAAYYRGVIAPVYAKEAARAASYATVQAMAAGWGAAMLAAVPAEQYAGWKAAIFTPVRAKLDALIQAGTVATPADLARAFVEVAAALGGD